MCVCVCVCVYLALYIIRHILQWSQEAKEIKIDLLLPTSIQSDHWSQYQFQPLCRTQVSPMPEEMHAPNIWSATAFLCNKFVFLSVCACSVCMPSCKICGLFSQFDVISPVHLGVRVGCVWGSQLESSSSLLIGNWSHGTSWRSHKKINNEYKLNNKLGKLPYVLP